MPRIPRHLLVEEGSTNHCTWRSHNFSQVLESDAAREKFLSLLRKCKEEFGVLIHSYCLMRTHPHVRCLSTKGQNPVRAGLVTSPNHWRWSSFRHYAFGEEDDLITDAPEYLALERTPAERREAYRHLFASPLSEGLRYRRPDLVHGPFVGDQEWVKVRADHLRALPAELRPRFPTWHDPR